MMQLKKLMRSIINCKSELNLYDLMNISDWLYQWLANSQIIDTIREHIPLINASLLDTPIADND